MARTLPAACVSRCLERTRCLKRASASSSGNHPWEKRELIPELDREPPIVTPFHHRDGGVLGHGWGISDARDRCVLAVQPRDPRVTTPDNANEPHRTCAALPVLAADALPKPTHHPSS